MFKNIVLMATVSLIAHLALNAEMDNQTMQQKRSDKYDMKLQQGTKQFTAKSDKSFDVVAKGNSEYSVTRDTHRGQTNALTSFASLTDKSFDLNPSQKQFARAK